MENITTLTDATAALVGLSVGDSLSVSVGLPEVKKVRNRLSVRCNYVSLRHGGRFALRTGVAIPGDTSVALVVRRVS